MLVPADLIDGLGRLVQALGASDSGVRVVLLAHELVLLLLLDVVERVDLDTAVAALAEAVIRAVDKVLLGAAVELAVRERVRRLARLDSSEGPARTAVALVLDLVDDTALPPVLRVWGGERAVVAARRVMDLRRHAAAEEAPVLGWGHSGELVKANPERVGAAVVLLDHALVGEEDAEADVVLLASVQVVGAAHPLNEGAFFVARDEGGGRHQASEKGKHFVACKVLKKRKCGRDDDQVSSDLCAFFHFL